MGLETLEMTLFANPLRLITFAWFFVTFALSTLAQSYTFTTLAGGVLQSSYADGTNGDARFNAPVEIAIDGSGAMYVADNKKVRKMVQNGSDWVVTTISVSLTGAVGFLALDLATNLYVADTAANAIRKLTYNGGSWTSSLIAGGNGFPADLQDGTNTSAHFKFPYGIALDLQGRIFVADSGNNAIRLITPVGTNWVTTTIAGGNFGGALLDGTNRATDFSRPYGLALDRAGNIFVADYSNYSIRKIAPVGTNWVTTTIAGRLAGTFPIPGSSDGTNRSAGFYYPYGIAVDYWGIVYVADSGNNTVRKIVPVGTNWITTTIGGLAGTNGATDGTGSDARFNGPWGVAVDSAGNVLLGDTSNYTIRLGVPRFGLQARTVQNALVLSWPAAASNFVLETRATLDPADVWTAITSGISLQSDTYFRTNSLAVPTAFFRLRR
jgi:hypothetical protein